MLGKWQHTCAVLQEWKLRTSAPASLLPCRRTLGTSHEFVSAANYDVLMFKLPEHAARACRTPSRNICPPAGCQKALLARQPSMPATFYDDLSLPLPPCYSSDLPLEGFKWSAKGAQPALPAAPSCAAAARVPHNPAYRLGGSPTRSNASSTSTEQLSWDQGCGEAQRFAPSGAALAHGAPCSSSASLAVVSGASEQSTASTRPGEYEDLNCLVSAQHVAAPTLLCSVQLGKDCGAAGVPAWHAAIARRAWAAPEPPICVLKRARPTPGCVLLHV